MPNDRMTDIPPLLKCRVCQSLIKRAVRLRCCNTSGCFSCFFKLKNCTEGCEKEINPINLRPDLVLRKLCDLYKPEFHAHFDNLDPKIILENLEERIKCDSRGKQVAVQKSDVSNATIESNKLTVVPLKSTKDHTLPLPTVEQNNHLSQPALTTSKDKHEAIVPAKDVMQGSSEDLLPAAQEEEQALIHTEYLTPTNDIHQIIKFPGDFTPGPNEDEISKSMGDSTCIQNEDQLTKSILDSNLMQKKDMTTISTVESTAMQNEDQTTMSKVESTAVQIEDQTSESTEKSTAMQNEDQITESTEKSTAMQNEDQSTESTVESTAMPNEDQITESTVESTTMQNEDQTSEFTVESTVIQNEDHKNEYTIGSTAMQYEDQTFESTVESTDIEIEDQTTESTVESTTTIDEALNCPVDPALANDEDQNLALDSDLIPPTDLSPIQSKPSSMSSSSQNLSKSFIKRDKAKCEEMITSTDVNKVSDTDLHMNNEEAAQGSVANDRPKKRILDDTVTLDESNDLSLPEVIVIDDSEVEVTRIVTNEEPKSHNKKQNNQDHIRISLDEGKEQEASQGSRSSSALRSDSGQNLRETDNNPTVITFEDSVESIQDLAELKLQARIEETTDEEMKKELLMELVRVILKNYKAEILALRKDMSAKDFQKFEVKHKHAIESLNTVNELKELEEGELDDTFAGNLDALKEQIEIGEKLKTDLFEWKHKKLSKKLGKPRGNSGEQGVEEDRIISKENWTADLVASIPPNQLVPIRAAYHYSVHLLSRNYKERVTIGATTGPVGYGECLQIIPHRLVSHICQAAWSKTDVQHLNEEVLTVMRDNMIFVTIMEVKEKKVLDLKEGTIIGFGRKCQTVFPPLSVSAEEVPFYFLGSRSGIKLEPRKSLEVTGFIDLKKEIGDGRNSHKLVELDLREEFPDLEIKTPVVTVQDRGRIFFSLYNKGNSVWLKLDNLLFGNVRLLSNPTEEVRIAGTRIVTDMVGDILKDLENLSGKETRSRDAGRTRSQREPTSRSKSRASKRRKSRERSQGRRSRSRAERQTRRKRDRSPESDGEREHRSKKTKTKDQQYNYDIRKQADRDTERNHKYGVVFLETEIMSDGAYTQFTQIGACIIIDKKKKSFQKKIKLKHQSLYEGYKQKVDLLKALKQEQEDESAIVTEVDALSQFYKTLKGLKADKWILFTNTMASVALLKAKFAQEEFTLFGGVVYLMDFLMDSKMAGQLKAEDPEGDTEDLYRLVMKTSWMVNNPTCEAIAALAKDIVERVMILDPDVKKKKMTMEELLSKKKKPLTDLKPPSIKSRSEDDTSIQEVEITYSYSPSTPVLVELKWVECIDILDDSVFIPEVKIEEGIDEGEWFVVRCVVQNNVPKNTYGFFIAEIQASDESIAAIGNTVRLEPIPSLKTIIDETVNTRQIFIYNGRYLVIPVYGKSRTGFSVGRELGRCQINQGLLNDGFVPQKNEMIIHQLQASPYHGTWLARVRANAPFNTAVKFTLYCPQRDLRFAESGHYVNVGLTLTKDYLFNFNIFDNNMTWNHTPLPPLIGNIVGYVEFMHKTEYINYLLCHRFIHPYWRRS